MGRDVKRCIDFGWANDLLQLSFQGVRSFFPLIEFLY